MGILVPKLVDSGHMLASPIPDIPSMVSILVSHFHLGILEPQGYMLIVYLHCSLKYRPGPKILLNTTFPLSILDPSAHMMSLHSQFLLEVSSLPILVVGKFILVHDVDLGRRTVFLCSVSWNLTH
jgi:hypothetical protein